MADSNEQSNGKNKSALDKVVMGAIIGTAIGSALGMSMAPKKGEETRKIVVEKTGALGNVAGETAKGFFKLGKAVLKRLFKGKEVKEPSKHSMKEIPNEMEILPSSQSVAEAEQAGGGATPSSQFVDHD